MSKLIALFCLFIITISLNFTQPALALDSNLKDQVAPLIERIMSLQSQGVEMDSLRKNPDRLAQCGKLMRYRQPIASSLYDEVSAFTDAYPPSAGYAGLVAQNLHSSAGNLSICVSCSRWAMESCSIASNSLKNAQKYLKKYSSKN